MTHGRFLKDIVCVKYQSMMLLLIPPIRNVVTHCDCMASVKIL